VSGFSRTVVKAEFGEVTVQTDQELRPDDRVAISVRPEDVDLSETRPAGDNVWEGRVEQKVFLGEAVDFQVAVGARTLLSRQHPTLRTKVGEAIFVQLDPEKCVVLKVS
jgi:iron(III) transport system ATP-binding protein